jgi:hypothetical protein
LKYFSIAKELSKELLDEFEKAISEGRKNNAIQSTSKFTELWED